jgi:hypothetical protein
MGERKARLPDCTFLVTVLTAVLTRSMAGSGSRFDPRPAEKIRAVLHGAIMSPP